MCGPGSSGDLPWLYIACDAVIRVQPGWGIYFLQRLGGEWSEKQAWKCQSGVIPRLRGPASREGTGRLVLSVVLAITMGQRRNVWRG